MEPMHLKPVFKNYLWGGNRLKSEYYKKTNFSSLAETWECAAHQDGSSIIITGQFQGQTLLEVINQYPEILGSKIKNKNLPILIKFIDAKENLSLQVHPDDEYAAIHENQNGKTEMWYVLDALPGASLICGFAHNVTKEQLIEGIKTGQLFKHLKKVKVHKGDVFHIPPGTIHAIGAGVLLAEVQENSNVTYRIYDYDRIDKNGNKRQLHFEKAIDILNMKAGVDIRQRPRKIDYYPGCSREILCRCKYFETELIYISISMNFNVGKQSFQVLLCLDGKGQLKGDLFHEILYFKKGDCIFIPAGMGNCILSGRIELLKIRC